MVSPGRRLAAIFPAYYEFQAGPGIVNGTGFDVDETERQRCRSNIALGDVRGDSRGFFSATIPGSCRPAGSTPSPPGGDSRVVRNYDVFRIIDAGYLSSSFAGRTGRRTNSPPQLGQVPACVPSAQLRQNVHSKLQIIASGEFGGRSQSQVSQFGRNSSMTVSSPATDRPTN